MENNVVFLENPAAKERFWDMFVVDALIGNRDRNNGNWGFVNKNGLLALSPVYDNGNSFANKAGDEKMSKQVANIELLRHSALKTGVCVFEENGKPINPYMYIGSCQDEDLNDALLRIVPKINVEAIVDFFNSVPGFGPDGLQVISEARREYYKQVLVVRYEEALLPAFVKVCELRGLNADELLCDGAKGFGHSVTELLNDAAARAGGQAKKNDVFKLEK